MKNSVEYITVKNPIYPTGDDPWVIKKDDEYFYCFIGSNTSKYGGVRVAKIPSLDKISSEDFSQVYTPPAGTEYSHEYWAPELHYIDGEWYIYVAADDGHNKNHRMYVLKGTSQDPTDPFEFVGKITDSTDKWAIDGTVVKINNELYFVWSGWEGDENVAQNIYIAHMSNPYTIDSERVMLSKPEYDWETVGNPHVNEGPAALYNGDNVFIAYSASGSWCDDYCIGFLTFKGGNPLDANSWQKGGKPFIKSKDGVAYGPGHCSFSTAADGSTWMVYHANSVSGTGWSGRSVWISPVSFDKDGKPIFEKAPSHEVEFPVLQ